MDKKLLEKSMQKLQKGDIAALDFIYVQTQKAVYYLAYSILKNKENAKDVVHDTYIRIIKNIGKYKLNTNAAAWILCCARNICLNEYAKFQRSVSLEKFEEALTDNTGYFSEVEGVCFMNKVFQILNSDEREIVILFAVKCFKHREIAEIVNKPEGTVKWLYTKTIQKLKFEIEQELNTPYVGEAETKNKENGFVFKVSPDIAKKMEVIKNGR